MISAGVPASSIRGRKVRTVWATPKTLTEKHQRQSLISCSQGSPPPPEVTPALANRRSQPALGGVDVVGQGHHRRVVGHVGAHAADRPEGGQLVDGGGEDRTLDVGHHHLGSPGEQRMDEPRPMPPAPPVTTATFPS